MTQLAMDYEGPGFDGETYEKDLDYQRLGKQSKLVFGALRRGEWLTLREIADATGQPEASVSARLRDFRKQKFGKWIVEAKRRGPTTSGVWIYRLAGKEQP